MVASNSNISDSAKAAAKETTIAAAETVQSAAKLVQSGANIVTDVGGIAENISGATRDVTDVGKDVTSAVKELSGTLAPILKNTGETTTNVAETVKNVSNVVSDASKIGSNTTSTVTAFTDIAKTRAQLKATVEQELLSKMVELKKAKIEDKMELQKLKVNLKNQQEKDTLEMEVFNRNCIKYSTMIVKLKGLDVKHKTLFGRIIGKSNFEKLKKLSQNAETPELKKVYSSLVNQIYELALADTKETFGDDYTGKLDSMVGSLPDFKDKKSDEHVFEEPSEPNKQAGGRTRKNRKTKKNRKTNKTNKKKSKRKKSKRKKSKRKKSKRKKSKGKKKGITKTRISIIRRTERRSR